MVINFKTVPLLLLVSFLLSACGTEVSEEENAFRKTLIDRALNDENRKLGDAFLAENKTIDGVITTASGMQYRVIKSGDGAQPHYQDRVEVHYEGRLVTGEVFDSSYTRHKPSIFPLTKVIKGWREALLKMRVGDHWQIYLPAELAYGGTSPSTEIAANSALIFKIELLAVIGDESE